MSHTIDRMKGKQVSHSPLLVYHLCTYILNREKAFTNFIHDFRQFLKLCSHFVYCSFLHLVVMDTAYIMVVSGLVCMMR